VFEKPAGVKDVMRRVDELKFHEGQAPEERKKQSDSSMMGVNEVGFIAEEQKSENPERHTYLHDVFASIGDIEMPELLIGRDGLPLFS
jgi:hypothetical protein